MAPLPLLKLASLLVKTLAKPLAARLKVEAKHYPSFYKLCISSGQFAHQITSRLNVIASGYKVIRINPVAEEEALDLGISFLSESFVFAVAGTIIVVEYTRNEIKKAEDAKQLAITDAEFKSYLETKFSTLSGELRRLNSTVSRLEHTVKVQDQVIEDMESQLPKEEIPILPEGPNRPAARSVWSWLGFGV